MIGTYTLLLQAQSKPFSSSDLFILIILGLLILIIFSATRKKKNTSNKTQLLRSTKSINSYHSFDESEIALNQYGNRSGEVYITKSNFQSIIRKSNLKSIDSSRAYSYDTETRKYLSEIELKTVISSFSFLQDPDYYVNNIYQPATVPEDQHFWVYEGISPSYHFDKNCPNLNSKYFNFQIPEQIREQNKVDEFRTWFESTRYLLEKEDYKAFTARLYSRFRIKTNARAIEVKNGGHEIFSAKTLLESRKNISRILVSIDSFKATSSMNKTIIDRFASNSFLWMPKYKIYNNDTGYSDKDVKLVLEEFHKKYKTSLIKALINHFAIELNSSLTFKIELLSKLNFRACSNCTKSVDNKIISSRNRLSTRKILDYDNDDDVLPF